MLNKILNTLVIASLLVILAKGLIADRQLSTDSRQQPKYNLTLSLQEVRNYYPDVDSIVNVDVNVYDVYGQGAVIGKVVNTSPLSDEIYGYNSITPLTVYLDEEDRIMEVEICENRESRSYLNKVINSGYLDLWDALTPKEAANHQVDAVSGCTFTSVAIAQSLQKRMEDISRQKGKYLLDWKLLSRQICVLIVTVLAVICFFMPKKTKTLHLITLLLSIAILGFYTNSLLSLALFCNWLANGISLALQIPMLVVAVLSIALPLFTKKSFYCQYLCPFGAAQKFVGMIPVKKMSVSAKVFRFFSFFRKIVLLALLVIFALGVGLDLSALEPFPVYNIQSIGFGVAIFAAVILIASIFLQKPWCNFICPTGTLLETFRRHHKK